jgi:glycosyltransferase 2 family protein
LIYSLNVSKQKNLKKAILKTLKFVSFFFVGILIFWWVYKDQDINHMKEVLTDQVDYFWIAISFLIGLVSHISRTIRWNMMIEPLGRKPRMLNTFLAVMVGYLMNLALPRMGEISRCGVISRYEKIPFTKLIGTVVVERLIDVAMLLLLLLIVILTQFGKIIEFLNNNPEVNEKFHHIIFSPWLIGTLIFIVVVIWIVRKKIGQSKLMKKIMGFVEQFIEGFKTIRTMKHPGWFIFHSVFIWFLYFIGLYCTFFAFDFTSHLTPLAGLTVFVFGSFGMVAPVQGGIGAWHFMVIEAMALYGVDRSDGKVFALLAHGSTTLMLIVLGLIGLLVLPFINERQENAE